MKTAVLILLIVAAAAAIPEEFTSGNRIVGGSVTTIGQYPFAVALLLNRGGSFRQVCGGTILNNRSVLTAAHCFVSTAAAANWRNRLGSTNANSGGVVHNSNQIIRHPSYNPRTNDQDVAVIRVVGTISYNNNVRQVRLAGSNYNVADNQNVWAIGWGAIRTNGPSSEQLRHVQVRTINLGVCRQRYATIGLTVTDNMLCSGILDVGGRDQCQGDSGGPLLHNNVQVGVCSWGNECAHPRFPGVNARVSRSYTWIVQNS